jgi:transcriptional regulator with XRE-family HTH domain
MLGLLSCPERGWMDYPSARRRFGDRLRMLREERELTQDDLARALNVPISHLLRIEATESSLNVVESLAEVAPIEAALPEPVQQTQRVIEQRQSDVERLSAAFRGIREAQRLADEYGINDILQDNGGKVLQVLILLGLRHSPGREGNDAVDSEGNEYELKTINRSLNKNAGVTTHHHLNKDILAKYRMVKAWYIAIYESVELKEIYRLSPTQLEPLFQQWEHKIETRGESLNNPKIPMRYVRQGERVFPT